MPVVTAVLPDRRAVELAVEHLVQDYGHDRDKITIAPVGLDNTMGERAAGADIESGHAGLEAEPEAAAVNGAIRVSLEVEGDRGEQVEKVLRDAGATDVRMGDR